MVTSDAAERCEHAGCNIAVFTRTFLSIRQSPIEKNYLCGCKNRRLLLDSRVVDVPMAYTPTFVVLSSLKPFFFNSLKNELCFADNAEA